MTDEIKAIIEKNLPAQVGSTLKDVLAQGEKDARDLKDLKDSYGGGHINIGKMTIYGANAIFRFLLL